MSTGSAPPAAPAAPAAPADRAGARRVRHQVRDAVLLMVFSAAASMGVAALMLLLLDAGR